MEKPGCPFDPTQDCPAHSGTTTRLDNIEKEYDRRLKMLENDNTRSKNNTMPKTSFWKAIGIVVTFIIFIGGTSFGLLKAQDDKMTKLHQKVQENRIESERMSGDIKGELKTIQMLLKTQNEGLRYFKDSIRYDMKEIKERLRKIEQKVQP